MKKLVLALALAYGSAMADTAAIVNSAVRVGQISKEDVRSLFLMRERRWNDGQLVVLFHLPNFSRAHKTFVRDVLGMTTEQYGREWDRLTNAGLSTYVRSVSTQKEMLYKVSQTSGGLGYLDSDYIIVNRGDSDAKMLRIVD